MAIFLSINVMMFTMALWTQDLYDARAVGLRSAGRVAGRLVSLPVPGAQPAGVVAAGRAAGFDKRLAARRARRRGGRSADRAGSRGRRTSIRAVSVFRGAGHVYFEVGCAVLVMVTFGRWLEATGKLRDHRGARRPGETAARRGARDRSPTAARETTPLATSRVGDLLRVLAGERIATDGRIVDGLAERRPSNC